MRILMCLAVAFTFGMVSAQGMAAEPTAATQTPAAKSASRLAAVPVTVVPAKPAAADEPFASPAKPKAGVTQPKPAATPTRAAKPGIPKGEAERRPTRGTSVTARGIIWRNTESVEEALAAPTELKFVDTPLSDVVDYLKECHKLEIQLDKRHLDEIGVAPDTPITRNLKGISLGAALRLILQDLDLTFVVDDGVLLITSQESAAEHARTIVYRVEDLVRHAEDTEASAADYARLINVARAVVRPQSWEGNEGAGRIVAFAPRGALVISQPQDIQEEVANLLKLLRKARQAIAAEIRHGGDPSGRSGPRQVILRSDEDEKIAHALDRPVQLEFICTPLSDFIDELQDTFKIVIELDKRKLDETGVAVDTPLTRIAVGIPLRTALRQLLDGLDLTYAIHDEVLLITTKDRAAELTKLAVYPVADLVLPAGQSDAPKADDQALMATIAKTIAPGSWIAEGGRGSMAMASGHLLVVAQTAEIQQKITDLLASLRQLPSLQPSAGTTRTNEKE